MRDAVPNHPHRTRRAAASFCLVTGLLLAIDLVCFAVLGLDCDTHCWWILLNLPGLPFGFASMLFVPSEAVSLAATAIAACLIWGAIAAGVAALTAHRPTSGGSFG